MKIRIAGSNFARNLLATLLAILLCLTQSAAAIAAEVPEAEDDNAVGILSEGAGDVLLPPAFALGSDAAEGVAAESVGVMDSQASTQSEVRTLASASFGPFTVSKEGPNAPIAEDVEWNDPVLSIKVDGLTVSAESPVTDAQIETAPGVDDLTLGDLDLTAPLAGDVLYLENSRTFTLTVQNAALAGSDGGSGIYAESHLVITGTTLAVASTNGDGAGIVVGNGGGLSIEGATVTATADQGEGVHTTGNIAVSSGSLTGASTANSGTIGVYAEGAISVTGDSSLTGTTSSITAGYAGVRADGENGISVSNDGSIVGEASILPEHSFGVDAHGGSITADGGSIQGAGTDGVLAWNPTQGIYYDITAQNGGTITGTASTKDGVAGNNITSTGAGSVISATTSANAVDYSAVYAQGDIVAEKAGSIVGQATRDGASSTGVWAIGTVTARSDGSIVGEASASAADSNGVWACNTINADSGGSIEGSGAYGIVAWDPSPKPDGTYGDVTATNGGTISGTASVFIGVTGKDLYATGNSSAITGITAAFSDLAGGVYSTGSRGIRADGGSISGQTPQTAAARGTGTWAAGGPVFATNGGSINGQGADGITAWNGETGATARWFSVTATNNGKITGTGSYEDGIYCGTLTAESKGSIAGTSTGTSFNSTGIYLYNANVLVDDATITASGPEAIYVYGNSTSTGNITVQNGGVLSGTSPDASNYTAVSSAGNIVVSGQGSELIGITASRSSSERAIYAMGTDGITVTDGGTVRGTATTTGSRSEGVRSVHGIIVDGGTVEGSGEKGVLATGSSNNYSDIVIRNGGAVIGRSTSTSASNGGTGVEARNITMYGASSITGTSGVQNGIYASGKLVVLDTLATEVAVIEAAGSYSNGDPLRAKDDLLIYQGLTVDVAGQYIELVLPKEFMNYVVPSSTPVANSKALARISAIGLFQDAHISISADSSFSLAFGEKAVLVRATAQSPVQPSLNADGINDTAMVNGVVYSLLLDSNNDLILLNDRYVITYDANDGTGASVDDSIKSGSNCTVATNSFIRSGWVFVGWNTAPDGSGTAYTAGATFTPTAPLRLYAQWKPTVVVSVSGTGGTISPSGTLQADIGDSIVLTITPQAGFVLSSLMVDGVDVTAAVAQGTYTLTVSGAHTVVANFSAVGGSTIPKTGDMPILALLTVLVAATGASLCLLMRARRLRA